MILVCNKKDKTNRETVSLLWETFLSERKEEDNVNSHGSHIHLSAEILFEEFLETDNLEIKGWVETMETTLLDFMPLNHSGESSKVMKKNFKFERKVQSNF